MALMNSFPIFYTSYPIWKYFGMENMQVFCYFQFHKNGALIYIHLRS